ncbi:MAG: DUF1559 domain-containing protein [Pirellulales bacterium]|nr:DUF1559 domain-containing protein [Pirellulales bacterium]
MLCPTSECRMSQTYNDLLDFDVTGADPCVNLAGSGPTYEPDGTAVANPCWQIVNDGLVPGSEDRRALVEEEIFLEHFNTNYTASWYLVRSAVSLDSSGNLAKHTPSCESSSLSRNSTLGPLTLNTVDASKSCPSSFIPLMGCGRRSAELTGKIGLNEGGTPLSMSFTPGPVLNPEMTTPSFAQGTSRVGPSGWWATWDKSTLQDYRGFAPVHKGACNILFADGSVRSFLDTNEDGLLNNGFEPTEENGFADAELELNPKEFASSWKLKCK